MTDWYAFTAANVDLVPDAPGVYKLGIPKEITYIGQSEDSIRTRLKRHLSGVEGRCTQSATYFQFELCDDPVNTELALLVQYQRNNRKLPRCNERVG